MNKKNIFVEICVGETYKMWGTHVCNKIQKISNFKNIKRMNKKILKKNIVYSKWQQKIKLEDGTS